MRFPQAIKDFIETEAWTFAKTYAATWPHEYIVRERVDENLFEQLVQFIREHGYEGPFYQKTYTYFEEDGLLYWTMGAPIQETTIINRCKKEDSYEYRRLKGTLPRSRNTEGEQTHAGDAAKPPA